MAKRRGGLGRVPKADSQRGGQRIVRARVKGQPAAGRLVQQFARVLKPVYRRGSIRTLIKTDESKGVASSDFRTLPGDAGTVNGSRGGYNGVKIMRQQPDTPPASGRNSRVIVPPSPTSGGGVRSAFTGSRVGRKRKG